MIPGFGFRRLGGGWLALAFLFVGACAPRGLPEAGPMSSPSSPLPTGGRASDSPPLTRGMAQHHPQRGVFLIIPQGWRSLEDPSGPAEPETILAVASYPIQRGGACAPVRALATLPSKGALAWVLEYRSPRGDAFPFRPHRFSLDPASRAFYECSGSQATYMFRFRDRDRYFQVHVAFGEETGEGIRDEMLGALSSLVVDRCPPAELPERVSEFGTLVPEEGPPGDPVMLSGPTGKDENWFWSPLDKIEVWWSERHLALPEEGEGKRLLATIDPGEDCTFEVAFRVPKVAPGRYLVTVLGYRPGQFGLMAKRAFRITD